MKKGESTIQGRYEIAVNPFFEQPILNSPYKYPGTSILVVTGSLITRASLLRRS